MKVKQFNLKRLGIFIYLVYLTAPLIGVMMAVVNSITFYAVVYPYIHQYVKWFNFGCFIACAIVAGLLCILFFYIFMLKGYLEYLNRNTLTKMIEDRLGKIEDKLGIG